MSFGSELNRLRGSLHKFKIVSVSLEQRNRLLGPPANPSIRMWINADYSSLPDDDGLRRSCQSTHMVLQDLIVTK